MSPPDPEYASSNYQVHYQVQMFFLNELVHNIIQERFIRKIETRAIKKCFYFVLYERSKFNCLVYFKLSLLYEMVFKEDKVFVILEKKMDCHNDLIVCHM